MLIELCNYCNLYLAITIVDNKPCCQFCADKMKKINNIVYRNKQ